MANIIAAAVPALIVGVGGLDVNLLGGTRVTDHISAPAPEAEVPEEGPDPIPVPLVFGDPLYTDHSAEALDRLPQQFRGDDY